MTNGLNKPQEYCGAEQEPDSIAARMLAAVEVAPAEATEWWFTLRHGSPELNCPQTGKSWALQNQVTGGLVPLPPLMMCISCGTALTLVDNGPTPPAGEDVKSEGAGPT